MHVDPPPLAAVLDETFGRAPPPPRLGASGETLAELDRLVQRLADLQLQRLAEAALHTDVATTVEQVGVATLLGDAGPGGEPLVDAGRERPGEEPAELGRVDDRQHIGSAGSSPIRDVRVRDEHRIRLSNCHDQLPTAISPDAIPRESHSSTMPPAGPHSRATRRGGPPGCSISPG